MARHILKAVLAIGSFSSPLVAKVVRVKVQSRADVAGGKTFGSVGPYEKAGRRGVDTRAELF